MADEQQRNTASAFPAPPTYYTHFTAANQERLKEFQTATTDDNASADEKNASKELPAELVYLIPPKPPTEGQYRSFGDTWNIPDRLPTLKELSIPQLFPEPSDESYNVDRAQELRRLCKSLLLNYLELVGIMGVSPAEFEEKVYHLRIHLINIHQLINEYRPHQARETLIAMMEEQLEKSRQETEENRKSCGKIRALMGELGSFDAGGLLTSASTANSASASTSTSTPPAAVTSNGITSNGTAVSGNEVEKTVGDERRDQASWEALQQAGL